MHFSVYDKRGQARFYLVNGDEGFQGSKVQVVVKGIHAQLRIRFPQVRKHVPGWFSVEASRAARAFNSDDKTEFSRMFWHERLSRRANCVSRDSMSVPIRS